MVKKHFRIYEAIVNESKPKDTGLFRLLIDGFYYESDIKDYLGEGRILKALNLKTKVFETIII